MKKFLVMFFGLMILTTGFVVAQMESYEIPEMFGYDCSIYGGMMIEEGVHGYDFCMQKGFNDFCLIDRFEQEEFFTDLNTGHLMNACGERKNVLYVNTFPTHLSCTNTLIQNKEKCPADESMRTIVSDHVICCKKNTGVVNPPSTNCKSSCDSDSCKICEGDTVLFTDSMNDEWDISLDFISSSSVRLDINGEITNSLGENDEWPFYNNRLLVNKIVSQQYTEGLRYVDIGI